MESAGKRVWETATILSIFGALAFLAVQTPPATPTEDQSAIVAIGTDDCANEIAMAVYEYVGTEASEEPLPAYIVYAAYDFETAEQANDALDGAPLAVARSYTGDLDLVASDLDEFIADVPTSDYGDRSEAYVLKLPTGDDPDELLNIEMLGIVEESQLFLVLVFSEGVAAPAAPGVALETIPPFEFEGDLEDRWDGTGDIRDVIPDEEEMPIGWERQEVTIENPPSC